MASNSGNAEADYYIGFDLTKFVPRLVDRYDPQYYPRMQEHLREYLDFINLFDQSNRERVAREAEALTTLRNAYHVILATLPRQEDKDKFYLEVADPGCYQVSIIMRAVILAEFSADWAKLVAWDAFLLGRGDEKPL
ncbi:uncharacterized protein RCC_06789 [Ramularia collo-cygni]|uniref:Uncharacterized protein n=1 Tax=Ramularia collo-cygni TaxID=112498 RepID=A0A2D3UZJ9_9PEZI|nr:uncharacterized protein RCC_06789 [Ramularia collo-cygni]CZT20928.1 uncharacterized protein RCC_06789 [Ramularia collo-cygni]